MRSEVVVSFGAEQETRVKLEGLAPMSHEEARRWLDEQFLAFEGEPLRATGKVLIADKVLAIARAAGHARFADAAWSQDFARASAAALAKPVVRVDVSALSVAY